MKNSLHLTVIALLLAASDLSAATHYVSQESTNPTPPYTNWVTAATNIQDAIDAAAASDEVVVGNGVYGTGGSSWGGNRLVTRVVVGKPLTLRSVNGPQVTIIQGFFQLGMPATSIVRCVYLANGANLCGFTLTGGGTWYNGDPPQADAIGGGAWCESPSATLSNCVLTGNSAFMDGGGAYSGTLNNCTLANNIGSGAAKSILNNCSLIGNDATSGGGAYDCTLNNCTLTGNSAEYGGGASFSTLYNCTLTGNSARSGGGGAYSSTLINCIVYYNTAGAGRANYYNGDYPDHYLTYCCTTPLPTSGAGNITNTPMFVDYTNGNLRLQSNSPCINAGNNSFVAGTTDLDGRPRVVAGTVDIGAYEFQPGISGAFIGWLQQYRLPTDGSADLADADADGMNNWQEWVCGTVPTNSISALRLLSAAPAGAKVTVSWQSVAGVNYLLKRSANLAAPFTAVATNIVGQPGTTTYDDANATGTGPFFYRVGVQPQAPMPP
jgi:hypothetical protein